MPGVSCKHLHVPAFHHAVHQLCAEELAADVGRIRVIEAVEHEAEVLRDLQRRNAAARPLPEVGRELPAPETGLVIALTFAQASAQDVLKLAGVVAGGGLVRQIEVALDDVVDVLQDHRGPLLDVLRGVEHRRRAAFGRTEGGGGQQGGLDLVAPDVGEPDGPLVYSSVDASSTGSRPKGLSR